MNDEQIKEVMRLADVIENLAWSAGKTEQYHDEPTDYAEKLPAARAELKAYLRTIGEPAGYSLPVGSMGEKKWAQLPKDCKPIGLVFQRIDAKTGAITEAGRVTWADWLAYPNGSKPAGNDLRWAAGVIEKYDAATIEDCHMIDSTDCAAILTALAEYRKRFDSPTPKHSEPESVNADLKMGQNNQEKGVKAA